MRKTKKQKDLYPKIYGYGSVEQLEADPTRFGDDPKNPRYIVSVRGIGYKFVNE